MSLAFSAPAQADTDPQEAAAIGALTLAFSDDPAARWMYPEPHRYVACFPGFARAFGGKAFEHDTAQTLPGIASAALWLPPDVSPDEDTVGSILQLTVPENLHADLFALFEQMGHARPSEPHWYLPLIGVAPSLQGQGYGSALLQAGLDVCDRDGLPAYLEATSQRNVPFYERHGFRVTGVLRAGASPVLYAMLRQPARRQAKPS